MTSYHLYQYHHTPLGNKVAPVLLQNSARQPQGDIITHTISWHDITYDIMISYYTGDIITLRANIIKISLSHRSAGLTTKRYRLPCSEKYRLTDSSTKGWIQNEFPSEN